MLIDTNVLPDSSIEPPLFYLKYSVEFDSLTARLASISMLSRGYGNQVRTAKMTNPT
jgi:hypothetical protein